MSKSFHEVCLYVRFSLEFPDSGSLSPEQCMALESTLLLEPAGSLMDMELDEM